MKVFVVSPKNKTVFNFRGDLIRAMIANGHDVVVTGPNKDHIERVLELGISRFIEIPLLKDKISPVDDLLYLRRLKRAMLSESPDLVLSYTAKPNVYGSLAARLAGVRFVYPMVTGLGTLFRSQGLKIRLLRVLLAAQYRVTFRVSQKVFFQNENDKATLVGLGLLPAEKAVVLGGSGVNLQRFAIAPLPDDVTFLFIGRLLRDKGVIEFLKACERIRVRYPQVRCLLVGPYDTNPTAVRPEHVEPYVSAGVVEYLGEQDDVRPFIAQATVLVLPSYHEGRPRVVLEAMSMGRPAITTTAPGCSETVQDNRNGFLVQVGSVDELVQRMEEFILDPGMAAVMGRESRRIAEQEFDVRKVNAVILQTMGLDMVADPASAEDSGI